MNKSCKGETLLYTTTMTKQTMTEVSSINNILKDILYSLRIYDIL